MQPCDERVVNTSIPGVRIGRRIPESAQRHERIEVPIKHRIAHLPGHVSLELGSRHPKPFMFQVALKALYGLRKVQLRQAQDGGGQVVQIPTLASLIERPKLRCEQLLDLVREQLGRS